MFMAKSATFTSSHRDTLAKWNRGRWWWLSVRRYQEAQCLIVRARISLQQASVQETTTLQRHMQLVRQRANGCPEESVLRIRGENSAGSKERAADKAVR